MGTWPDLGIGWENGIPVVCVTFPAPMEGGVGAARLREVSLLAAKEGCPLLDLRGVYINQRPVNLTLTSEGRTRDAHLNVKGNRLVGDRLYKLMLQHPDYFNARPRRSRSVR